MYEGNQYGFSLSLRTESSCCDDNDNNNNNNSSTSSYEDEGPLPYQKRFILGVNKIRPLYRKLQKREDHPRDTIPVSVLRQFIQKRFPSKWEKTYKYVLCDFNETLSYAKKRALPYDNITRWMYTNLKNCDPDESKERHTYGFDHTVIEKISPVPDESDNFDIIRSLIARIHAGHKFMNWCIRENDRKLKFCAQLFIDSHLDLSIYVTKHGVYEDTRLLHPYDNMEYIIMSALDTYYPFEDRFAYFGNLPDMTTCIDMGNLWYDVRPKSKSLISALIHIIACKPLNHKCQWRNFIEILWDYVSKYPVISDLYRLLIEVSLMGNYPYAEVRPSFIHRMDIRKAFGYGSSVDEFSQAATNKSSSTTTASSISFSCKQLITDNELFLWMTENEHIICQITTEYYMYNVITQHALDSVLEYYDHWKNVKQLIRKGTDIIRREVNNFDIFSKCITDDKQSTPVLPPAVNCFESTKRELQLIHQKTLVYISKLKKTGFIDIIITELNKYNERNVINKYSTSPQTSEMYLQSSKANIDKINTVSEDGGSSNESSTESNDQFMHFMNLVCEHVASLRTNRIETKWLKCLGITPNGYEYIRDLYYRYECEDIADNSISKDIDKIFKNSERDFHLIRVYVKTIQKLRSVRSYVLSSDYGVNQLKALRAKRCMMWWEQTPEDIDLFYYCSSCKKWAAPVVDSRDEKKRLNYHALGREKALYDPHTKQLYCGKQTTSISVKKYMDNGTYFATHDISDTRIAKTIRNHKENLSCNGVPLIGVHMLNICQKLDDKKWALCEICGWLTQYEGAKFGSNGFTCGMHDVTPKKKPIMYNKDTIAGRKAKNFSLNSNTTDNNSITEPRATEEDNEDFMKLLEQSRLDHGLKEIANELDYCVYCGLLCLHDTSAENAYIQQIQRSRGGNATGTATTTNNNNNSAKTNENNGHTSATIDKEDMDYSISSHQTANIQPDHSNEAALANKKRKQNLNNIGIFVKIVDDDVLKKPVTIATTDHSQKTAPATIKAPSQIYKTVCLCYSDFEKVKDKFAGSIILKSTLFRELTNIRSKIGGVSHNLTSALLSSSTTTPNHHHKRRRIISRSSLIGTNTGRRSRR
jgi:hypothetical protein